MLGGKTQRRVLAVLVLAALIAGIFVVTRSTDRYPASKTLPDGTIVKVKKVTYGKIHRYVQGNFLQVAAAKILPESLQHRFRIKVLSFTNSIESVALWFETTRTNVAIASSPGANTNSSPLSQVFLIDPQGKPVQLRSEIRINTATNVTLEAHQIALDYHPAIRLQFRIVRFAVVFTGSPMPPSVGFETPNPVPRVPPK